MKFSHDIGYVLGIVVVIFAPFAFYYLMKYFSKVLCVKFHKREIVLRNLIKEKNMTEEEKKEQRIAKTIFKYILLFTVLYIFLFYVLPLILLLGMLIVF